VTTSSIVSIYKMFNNVILETRFTTAISWLEPGPQVSYRDILYKCYMLHNVMSHHNKDGIQMCS
jgi:hypothetical protein